MTRQEEEFCVHFVQCAFSLDQSGNLFVSGMHNMLFVMSVCPPLVILFFQGNLSLLEHVWK